MERERAVIEMLGRRWVGAAAAAMAQSGWAAGKGSAAQGRRMGELFALLLACAEKGRAAVIRCAGGDWPVQWGDRGPSLSAEAGIETGPALARCLRGAAFCAGRWVDRKEMAECRTWRMRGRRAAVAPFVFFTASGCFRELEKGLGRDLGMQV